ncbi:hypothetical protein HNY73_023242 [Argiope bruennichi]|uniref:Uncharacterized protein n=1 Tax=Argiope bruennichi TaxID=94029 RepID=A0A8T0E5Y4_ARGBR|nr:hypothetical protein HNY73_023242 [Argiope bruennichi]
MQCWAILSGTGSLNIGNAGSLAPPCKASQHPPGIRRSLQVPNQNQSKEAASAFQSSGVAECQLGVLHRSGAQSLDTTTHQHPTSGSQAASQSAAALTRKQVPLNSPQHPLLQLQPQALLQCLLLGQFPLSSRNKAVWEFISRPGRSERLACRFPCTPPLPIGTLTSRFSRSVRVLCQLREITFQSQAAASAFSRAGVASRPARVLPIGLRALPPTPHIHLRKSSRQPVRKQSCRHASDSHFHKHHYASLQPKRFLQCLLPRQFPLSFGNFGVGASSSAYANAVSPNDSWTILRRSRAYERWHAVPLPPPLQLPSQHRRHPFLYASCAIQIPGQAVLGIQSERRRKSAKPECLTARSVAQSFPTHQTPIQSSGSQSRQPVASRRLPAQRQVPLFSRQKHPLLPLQPQALSPVPYLGQFPLSSRHSMVTIGLNVANTLGIGNRSRASVNALSQAVSQIGVEPVPARMTNAVPTQGTILARSGRLENAAGNAGFPCTLLCMPSQHPAASVDPLQLRNQQPRVKQLARHFSRDLYVAECQPGCAADQVLRALSPPPPPATSREVGQAASQ